MGMSLSLSPRCLARLDSPYQTALQLYGESPKIIVDVPLNRKKLPVPAALINVDDLSGIFGGEKYAGTTGGMFFITEEMPLKYRHFAAFHELAEHAAPKGFDITGLAGHFQAIVVELAYAKNILSQSDFDDYLVWRKSVERSNYFKLNDDGLVDKITQKIHAIFESLPNYLTYRNRQLVDLIEES